MCTHAVQRSVCSDGKHCMENIAPNFSTYTVWRTKLKEFACGANIATPSDINIINKVTELVSVDCIGTAMYYQMQCALKSL